MSKLSDLAVFIPGSGNAEGRPLISKKFAKLAEAAGAG